MYSFVKENKLKLPGPLTWLQSNTYTDSTSSLAGQLAPFMGLPESNSRSVILVNPAFLCPSFVQRTDGNTSQEGASLHRAGGRGGPERSGKFGYFGHPRGGGDPKLITEVNDPVNEIILYETDNFFGSSQNTSHTVRHGIIGGKAIRTTNYMDGHAKLALHKLTRR